MRRLCLPLEQPLKEMAHIQHEVLNWDSRLVARVKYILNYESFTSKTLSHRWIWILPRRMTFLSFLHDRHTLDPFFSDWLMLKIVERDWLMNLRGTSYRFDKTNDYKRMKRNNDGKCLFLITQWKPVMLKILTTFYRRWTISFKPVLARPIIFVFRISFRD